MASESTFELGKQFVLVCPGRPWSWLQLGLTACSAGPWHENTQDLLGRAIYVEFQTCLEIYQAHRRIGVNPDHRGSRCASGASDTAPEGITIP